jgi:uncharacterized membrane protein
MSLLSIVVFLHVLAAVIWVGGGVIMHILISGAVRTDDKALLVRRMADTHNIGSKIFAPTSLLLFLLGFAILGLTQTSPFSAGWIISGIVGFAFSFVVGFFYLGPESGRLAEEYEAGNAPDARLLRMVTTMRVEMTVLLVVLFLMVTKPF